MTQPENSPLVSIIIPAYNTAGYIHRAIGSSIRQTHKNIEILIIDDGSTDNTLKVAEYFAGTDSRIRIFTQKNAGVSAARNHGIDKAKGEYICFLDSDDWLEDDAVETLLNAQKEHPDSVICANYCWKVKLEGDNLFKCGNVGKTTPSFTADLKWVAESFCPLGKPCLFNNVYVKLFRTPFKARFPEGIKFTEDAAFFIRYFLESGGKAYYIDRVLQYVLSREGSATRGKYTPENFDSETAAYKIMIDLMKDEYCKRLMLMSYTLVASGCFGSAVRENNDYQEIKRVKSALRSSAWSIISFRGYPLKRKVRVFIAAYFPVSFFKAFVRVWDFLKMFLPKEREEAEIVSGWQDFPKAPGIPV